MTDADREELKTLIRETIREMAKEAAEIMWNTPVSRGPSVFGHVPVSPFQLGLGGGRQQ